MKKRKDETDKCYLIWNEGYLTCTHNHSMGGRCLLHPTEEEEREMIEAYTL